MMAARSKPRVTLPACGASKPAAMAKSVDLPQPDGPISAVTSPLAAVRLTPSITFPSG